MALLTGEKTKRPLQLSALQAMWGLRVSQQGTCSKTFFFFFFLPPSASSLFSFFTGRYSPWLKEFNFHLLRGDIQFQTQAALWWALKRDAVECRERKPRAHCRRVCRADVRRLSIHLLPQPIAAGPAFEFDFDCYAGHSQPTLTLQRSGNRGTWSGICSWKDIGQAPLPCPHARPRRL